MSFPERRIIKMKKKLIVLIILSVFFVFEFIVYTLNAKVTCKKMFGIDESDYVVMDVNNSLSVFKSGGRYRITIGVNEEQLPFVIDSLEKKNLKLMDDNYDSAVIIEDLWGLDIKNVERFYKDTRFSRRTFISYLTSPVMSYRWAIISKNKEGYYVTLLYMEHNVSR